MPGQMIPTGVATGGAGAIFRKEVTQAIAAAARFILPVGTHYVYSVGADVRMQVLDSLGAWNNITAAGVIPSGAQISDGANLGCINNGGGAENILYITVG